MDKVKPQMRQKGAFLGAGGRHSFTTRVVAAVLAACATVAIVPIAGWALVSLAVAPTYDWYSEHSGTADDPYIITTSGMWVGFVNVVNGTADIDDDGTADPADSFDGKIVQIDGDLTFIGGDVVPAGGHDGTSFNGTLDGQGHTIDNFTLQAQDGSGNNVTENIGLIGAAGASSEIKNITIGKFASFEIELSAADNTLQLKNIGLLVGVSQGSLSNCTNKGAVSVTHNMDQTKTLVFPIENVGGLGGMVMGDISGCTNEGSVSVTENGVPYKAKSDETDWNDQSNIAINIGGIVGCAGDTDSSINSDTTAKSDTISKCTNSGTIQVRTPQTNGLDRFGNQVYSQSANVGGLFGYSRSSIFNCTNTGNIDGDHTNTLGGIVGGLRSKMTGSSYNSNFSSEGYDDGMLDGAPDLTIKECYNSGLVVGYAFPAGISGRAGTHTVIEACINESDAYVLGSRPTKPFPSGIVGSTYGTVRYCANLGTVAAGEWANENERKINTSAGYYAAGIAGNTSYFTASVNGSQVRQSPLPEVYGCYNAGAIMADDNMRQRALVGDNAGYVHDNVAEKGKVYNDMLVYGMYSTDTESSGGTAARNYIVSNSELKDNTPITTDQGDNSKETVPEGSTVLSILNSQAASDSWAMYWTKSNGSGTDAVNNGYPVLDSQVFWDVTDLSSAKVELVANAEYTGLEAIPTAKVTLGDTTLTQNVDFKVVPQEGATEISVGTADETPYTGTVVGIGNYGGTAAKTFRYGIGKGELANATVLIDTVAYNWTAQEPAESSVHVTNMAGQTIEPEEYTFALDPNDTDLSYIDNNGEATDNNTGVKGAVNAKDYTVIITAADDSEHFVGNTTGEFTIRAAQISYRDGDDNGNEGVYAYPTAITYLEESYAWDSMTARSSLPESEQNENLVTFEYTGHSIKPTVDSVVYKGRELTEGVDYRVLYDAIYDDGTTSEDDPNVGVAGGEGYGYVTVRYVAGGNFRNYDNMKFLITDDGTKNDLKNAEIKGTEDVIYEEGTTYTPITVWYGGSQLNEGVDYTIVYQNNDRIGEASFTITAVEDSKFSGSVSGTFKIVEGVAYEFTYDIDEQTREAAVTGVVYSGAKELFDMVIPSTVEINGISYSVTAIKDKAFGGSGASDFTGSEANLSKQKIASVVIPDTVTSIGSYAFGSASANYPMSNLVSVTLGNGSHLQSIGDSAFRTSGIISIRIPADVENIGSNAFRQCSSLSEVTFLSTSADKPTFDTGKTTNSFYAVQNVTASGFDSATSAKAYVESKSGDGWIWNTLVDEPATISKTSGATGTYGYADGSLSISVTVDVPQTTTATYQWYSCSAAGDSKEVIEGATETEYLIPVGMSAGAAYYCCEVSYTMISGLTGIATSEVISVDIQQALLEAAYVSETITEGDTPALEVSVSGFVNNETAAIAAGYVAPYVEAPSVDPGVYTLTPSGGSADNYTFSYTSGILTIEKGEVTYDELSGGESGNRFDTMEKIVEAAFDTSAVAVLVTGDNFPDALAAASLAGALDAPVVMVGENNTSQAVDTLNKLGVTSLYVIGGESAVPADILEAVKKGAGNIVSVSRIEGKTRQETALNIAKETAVQAQKSPTAIIATGKTFADALSISPYSYATYTPIYLTQDDGTLDADTLSAIKEAGYTSYIYVGGKDVVSDEVTKQIGISEEDVTRFGDTTRYGTSAKIAEFSVTSGVSSYGTVVVSTGENYPDALAGAAYCARASGVMVLANSTSAAQPVLDLLHSNSESVNEVTYLGSYGAVDEATRNAVKEAIG